MLQLSDSVPVSIFDIEWAWDFFRQTEQTQIAHKICFVCISVVLLDIMMQLDNVKFMSYISQSDETQKILDSTIRYVRKCVQELIQVI